ncbi:MAG TPA: 4Fe-4S dicluster domain-containing protein [Nitrospirae bacterium]|nr:tetrathionate reductase subunit B precursor [bacterium BMS3Abin08]HDY70691.1 4Fe-4S dicluster domain-containing protein [Nitrospirota bacterium]
MKKRDRSLSRRTFLKGTAAGFATLAIPVGTTDASVWETFFQKHFLELNENQKSNIIKNLEKEYYKKYNKKFNIKTTKALPGTLFGYGLDLSRCIGCRRCVYACVRENNQSRDPQVQWITVLRFKEGEKWVSDLEESEKYYYPEEVPEKGYFYMPVQCQQCERPPCVKVCPTQATWKEPDGIVVVDYNWCIGCRYCMAACPYGARRFNWGQPRIAREEINTETHYLGNRPRTKGIVEKCTFCIQRTRGNPGRYPACVEICPVGARKFGNLLDPDSEIRYIIENKRVFRLKEELNTNPKFYYFFAT